MNWLLNNLELVVELTLEHIRLSIIPILAGFAASIPLGWLAHRIPWLRGPLLSLFGVLFSIPSLALFIMLPSILGTRILDDSTIVIPLTIYAIAMMLRGAVDGFDNASAAVQDSATALGFSPAGRFWRVQLPLAGPVLLASLRVVSVSTVSLVGVGALIGKGGLGYLFINGYQRDIPAEILVGIGGVLLIALVFDQLLALAGRVLLPWSRRMSSSRRGRESVMTVRSAA